MNCFFIVISQVIFVLRNPKDVAVSLWNFVRPIKFNPKHEKWDTFLDLYCTEEGRCLYSYLFTILLDLQKEEVNDKLIKR